MQPTITKVDARRGTVTVKMEDKNGMDVEKLFQLTEDVEYLDSTGRVATLDVFQCGDEVLIIEMEGKLKELKRATLPTPGPTGQRTPTQAAVASGQNAQDEDRVSQEDIRLRAYRKWESAGKPFGDGTHFWLAAEDELRHEEHQHQAFQECCPTQ